MAAAVRALKLLTLSCPSALKPPQPSWVCCGLIPLRSPTLESRSRCAGARFLRSSSSKSDASVQETAAKKKKKKKKKKGKGKGEVEGGNGRGATAMEALVKRRTRSSRELDDETVQQLLGVSSHIPVLLGEVLDIFSGRKLRSFVDCTLGAAGHSSAIIQSHPELKCYLGLDVDPMAHQMAKTKIDSLLCGDSSSTSSNLRGYFLLRNFRFIKSVVDEVGDELMDSGFDGILMDLGVSSMQVNNAERGFSVLNDGPLDMRMDPQASLKAEDILNSWPESEVGRILREYGEEINWFSLQNKIVKSRVHGGLHSTGDLVSLIQKSTPRTKGRQGWIKTATRVFQALRIAVNDELKTLQDSLYSCFECLAPGGRLAVISFHSLEDRIVKQTFLDIVRGERTDEDGEISDEMKRDLTSTITNDNDKEVWIRQMIQGERGRILTKRPITPSEKEEKLNRRSRSAKLRVIEKI
ncbi:uncharacterized protein LOC115665838 [Syzygium oleosum]|uniref:uncharacterized protein LOC115665838 n=1 Tax=Syzygium oleosum TaxID=219896 RepID=UPI0024BA3DF8|nr:uncharacterized protein LOC115665838 [Syzygium oleosum]